MANENHASPNPPYITVADVCRLVSMEDLIAEIRRALMQFSAGEEKGGVVQPVRTAVSVKDHAGVLLSMPAYARESNCLAVKLVCLYPGNPARGLPSHMGVVVVFDPSTGSPLAFVDAGDLTSLRTAAASACAIKALVPAAPKVLCVVGTGAEARSHVQACRVVNDYEEVRIWGRNKDSAQKCADDVGGGAVVYESLETAVSGADVVVTVTLATQPLVCGKWIKTGAVVCCVGACRPDWRELDDELMHNAVVIADSRDAASKESGDIILSKAEVYAEIGEILSGSKPLPKVPECGKKYYMFKSLGMAVEDVVSAKLVYDKYIADTK